MGRLGTASENAAEPAVRLYTDRWAVMAKAESAPLIDGEPGEREWAGAAEISGFVTMFHNRPAGRDMRAKLLYDDRHLYVALESASYPAAVPEAENVFLLFGTPSERDVFYSVPVVVRQGSHPIVIGYNNWTGAELTDRRQQFIELGSGHGVRQAVSNRTDGSWSAEISIPLNALGSQDVQSGAEWRFNIIRYCGPDASEPLCSWIPIRTGTVLMDDIHRPLEQRIFRLHVFVANEGRLGSVFVDRPPAGGPTAGPGMSTAEAVAAEPSAGLSASLKVRSFTCKTLVLHDTGALDHPAVRTTAIVWVDPLGRETPVEATAVHRQGTECKLDFVHPEPRVDGLYQIRLPAEKSDGSAAPFALLMFDRCDLIAAGERAVRPLAQGRAGRMAVPYAPPSGEVLFLERLIPKRIGFFGSGVPHRPLLGFRSTNFTWSPESPWSIRSVDDDGMAYPNDQYPESKSLTVWNKRGESVVYPYYEDGEGGRYFLSAHLWHFQRKHAVRETARLASEDPLGAARLLYRFARRYEGWVRMNDSVWVQHPVDGRAGPPYPYFGGMWDRWSLMDLHGLLPLLEAFIEVERTDAFEVLSGEAGEDVRSAIINGMLRPSLESALTYPVLQHNVDYPNWIGLILLGKALGEPQYVHEAVERMAKFAECSFLPDGFWKEITLSYHLQTINGIRQTIRHLQGWSDPPGYVSPRDGRRFDSFDPEAVLPLFGRMIRVPGLLAYPDGACVPVNDTWASQKAEQPMCTESLSMPAAGIVKLTRGAGADQAQLYLTFSPYNGHDHKDPLQLSLYAEGQELLPDLGYTHTFYRQWTLSTLGHNTVTVNGRDASVSGRARGGGNLELFSRLAGPLDVQTVRARQEHAYEEVSVYERELWFVGFEDAAGAEGYVLDLFRVCGGTRHEYALNGDANRDAVMSANLALAEYGPHLIEGHPDIILPKQETDTGGTSDNQYYAYTYVKDVRTAELPDGAYVMAMTTSGADGQQSGMQVHGYAGPGNNRVFLGRAPSLRSTRLNGLAGDRNSEAVRYELPKWIVRRERAGEEKLNSQFVHVMEPCAAGSAPRIGRVDVLLSDEASQRAVVAVTYGDVTDIVISAPRYSGEPLRTGEWELEGKAGIIRMVNGTVRHMALIGGTRLAAPGRTLSGSGPVSGTIADVLQPDREGGRHVLITGTALPPDVTGPYIVVTHPDSTTSVYPIASICRCGITGQTRIELDEDPGFAYTEAPSGQSSEAGRASRMTCFPQTVWTGPHTFHIDNSVKASFPPA
ncbi:heparinase II/III family protein [Paenibacillus sp. GYB004]|uniref:heparinase II/III domain-containing protein n=1 Tax=Paenibacillus sp. GYB004 TaxID=2994393 RepID=UPI002F96A3FE